MIKQKNPYISYISRPKCFNCYFTFLGSKCFNISQIKICPRGGKCLNTSKLHTTHDSFMIRFSYNWGIIVEFFLGYRPVHNFKNTEAYSELSQKSKMDIFAKILNNFQLLFTFEKSAVQNVWQGFIYTTGIRPFCLYWLGSVCDSNMVQRILSKIWMGIRFRKRWFIVELYKEIPPQ